MRTFRALAGITLFAVALPCAAQQQALFNGKDLSGWQHVGEGSVVVENGLLKTQDGMGLLWYTREKFSNARITVVYKTEQDKDNSGVFIRIPEPPTEPWMPVNRGYEVQIDEGRETDAHHRTGTLYSLTEARATPGKLGQWNTMEITLDGERTEVRVNGVLVTDFREGDPTPPKTKWYEPERGPRPNAGYIGIQNHLPGEVVWFKEISVAPLD